jgi:hypothetical protein
MFSFGYVRLSIEQIRGTSKKVEREKAKGMHLRIMHEYCSDLNRSTSPEGRPRIAGCLEKAYVHDIRYSERASVIPIQAEPKKTDCQISS